MADYLWMAFVANNSTNDVLVCSSPDGKTWTPQRFISQASAAAPAIAYYDGTLYVAFKSNDPSNRILITCTSDGQYWSEAQYTNQTTSQAPALAVCNGNLYLAFISNDSRDAILVCSSDGIGFGNGFGNASDTNQSSSIAPSFTAQPYPGVAYDVLEMALVANNSGAEILIGASSDGVHWAFAADAKQSCYYSPSVVWFNNKLQLAFNASNDTGDLLICSCAEGGAWSGSTRAGHRASSSPYLTVFNGNLFMGFAGAVGDSPLKVAWSSDGVAWPAQQAAALNQSSLMGGALAVAPFQCKPAPPVPGISVSGAGPQQALIKGTNFPSPYCTITITSGAGFDPSGPWSGNIVSGITIDSPCQSGGFGGEYYVIQVVSDEAAWSFTINC